MWFECLLWHQKTCFCEEEQDQNICSAWRACDFCRRMMTSEDTPSHGSDERADVLPRGFKRNLQTPLCQLYLKKKKKKIDFNIKIQGVSQAGKENKTTNQLQLVQLHLFLQRFKTFKPLNHRHSAPTVFFVSVSSLQTRWLKTDKQTFYKDPTVFVKGKQRRNYLRSDHMRQSDA